MLASMPGNAAASASPKTASFASLLAGFAAPPRPDPDWKDDGLEDDIATISYEQALRTHARIHPVSAPPSAFEQVVAESSLTRSSPRSRTSGRKLPSPERIAEWVSKSHVRQAAPQAAPLSRRKSASVTVRLSAEERVQLQQRAAAAGLTASAYLRSCLFEAETLRAQVKEALEQFRTGGSPGEADQANRAEGASQSPVQSTAQAAQSGRWWLPSRWLGGRHARTA